MSTPEATTVSVAGKVRDYKASLASVPQEPDQWHFKFSAAKWFVLRIVNDDVQVKGEINFLHDVGTFQSITKENKMISDISTNIIPIGIPINAAKITDVTNLLKKYLEDNWQELQSLDFNRGALSNEVSEENDNVSERCGKTSFVWHFYWLFKEKEGLHSPQLWNWEQR